MGGGLSVPLYGTLSSGLAVNNGFRGQSHPQNESRLLTTPVLNGAVLFEVDVLPAGSFTDAGAFSVSIGIEFERLSSDCDLMIGIRIGTDVFLVSAQDNNNGLYTLLRGTHTPGETHATRPISNHQEIASSTGKTEPETIAITFSWAAGATDGSVSITLANGFSTTLAMTGGAPPAFSSAVSGMLVADSDSETYKVHSLTFNGFTFTGAQMGGGLSVPPLACEFCEWTSVGEWAFSFDSSTAALQNSGTGQATAATPSEEEVLSTHPVYTASGKTGGGLVFDGVDDAIRIDTGFTTPTAGWTACLWIKMVAHNAFNGRSYIIDFRYGGGSACWFLDLDDTMKLNLESVSFS